MPTPRRLPSPALPVPAIAIVLVFVLALSAFVPTATAQLPSPSLQNLYPPGAQAGSTVDAALAGGDLENVHSLWFDDPGIRAFHKGGLNFTIAVSSAVKPGHYDVRAVGPYGVSNPRVFVVGDRPESLEAEPNNTPAEAKPIARNSTVNARIQGGTDVDNYSIEGKAGDRLFLDIEAARIDGKLNAAVKIFDPVGRPIREAQAELALDPFLDLTLPADGKYVIQVHDLVYDGSPDHFYRLTVSDGPRVDAIVPAVAAPGVETEFTIFGRNIAGTPVADLRLDGGPIEERKLRFTLPPIPNRHDGRRTRIATQAGGRWGWDYALATPKGTANPIAIAQATQPVVLETEPNDDSTKAQTVPVPSETAAMFNRPGDRDLFRFAARKGEVLWIEAVAEAVGSPADPSFAVQRIVPNGEPQDVGQGDDTPDRQGNPRYPSSSVDASFRLTVPEDGTYQIAVTDLLRSQRGDPRLFYHLIVRRESPDFRLFLVPSNPGAASAVNVGQGGRATAHLHVWRLDGFNGPIRVEARDLPTGVKCPPVYIPANQAVAPIVFEAAPDAPLSVQPLVLVGSSRWGDRKEALDDQVPEAFPIGPPIEREAVAGSIVWPAAPQFEARCVRGCVLAVHPYAPFRLTAARDRYEVGQGHTLPIPLKLDRRPGCVDPVKVNGLELAPGLANPEVTIAANVSEAALPLAIPKGLAPGVYSLLLSGAGQMEFSKDLAAKTKPKVNVTGPSNIITVWVRPAPAHLAVNANGGAIRKGQSLTIDVTVNRQNNYAGAISIGLSAPAAAKLSAPEVTIPAGQNAAKLTISAAADSPQGAVASAAIRATATVQGRTVEVDEPLALTVNP